MLFIQKMPGAVSLSSALIKLLTISLCIPGGAVFPSLAEDSSTRRSDDAMNHWNFHRAGLRSNPVHQQHRADQVETSDSIEAEPVLSSSSAVTPKNTFSTSEDSSDDDLTVTAIPPTASGSQLSNVVEDKANRTPKTSNDKIMFLDRPKTNGDTGNSAKPNVVTSIHEVPFRTGNFAAVPRSKSSEPKQKEKDNVPYLTLGSNYLTHSISHANSLPMPDTAAKPVDNYFSKSILSNKPETSAIVSPETNEHVDKDYQERRILPDQSVESAAVLSSSDDRLSEIQEDEARASATRSLEFGFNPHSNTEDSETRKEERKSISGEDSSETLRRNERDNGLIDVTTTKSETESERRKNNQQLKIPKIEDGESTEVRRSVNRRRGGRRRNRKRFTTSSPITKPATVVPSFVNGNTLKWTVATPIPQWEERRRNTRDTQEIPEAAVTNSDSRGAASPEGKKEPAERVLGQGIKNLGPSCQTPIVCSRSFMISCAALGESDKGIINYYQYCYYKPPEETYCRSWINGTMGTHEFAIEFLEPNTKYAVVVRVVHKSVNSAPESENATRSVLTAFGIEISNLTAEIVTDNSARINVSTIGRTASISYRLSNQQLSFENELTESALSENLPSYSLYNGSFSLDFAGLIPCTNYTLVVWPSSPCSRRNSENYEKTIMFKTPPGTPSVSNLTAAALKPGSPKVQISWEPADLECFDEIIGYNVSWRPTEDGSDSQSQVINAERLNLTLQLKHNQKYAIDVSILTKRGSLMERSITYSASVPDEPLSVSLNLTSCSRIINASYAGLETSKDVSNCSYHYCFSYSEGSENCSTLEAPTERNEFQIKALLPDTNYTVFLQVVCVNSITNETLQANTTNTKSTASDIDVYLNNTSVDSVTNNSAKIVGFILGPTSSVGCRISPPTEKECTANVTSQIFRTELEKLGTCTNYTVEFWAVSSCAANTSENYTKKAEFRTRLGVAPIVQNLEAEARVAGSNTAFVSWHPPDTECAEDISGYEVRWFKADTEDFNSSTTEKSVWNVSLASLEYNTNYTVKVAAYTEEGTSQLNGNFTSKTFLSRREKPYTPTIINVTPCSQSIKVSYTKLQYSDESIQHYEYCYVGSETNCTTWNTTDVRSSTFDIKNLNQNTSYTVYVRAVSNDNGTLLYGDSAENKTVTLPDIHITEWNVTSLTMDSAVITGSTDGPSSAVHYRIILPTDKNNSANASLNGQNFSIPLKKLDTCTNYTVEFWVESYCSSNTYENDSNTAEFRTHLGVAPIVENLKAWAPEAGSNIAFVSWDPPNTKCADDISGYVVRWFKTDGAENEGFNSTTTEKFVCNVSLQSLEYNTNHTVEVAAYTKEGTLILNGTFTNTSFLSRREKPLKPSKIDVIECSRSINFTYEPANANESVEFYEYCWTDSEKSDCSTCNATDIGSNSFLIKNLKQSTSYTVSVRAASEDKGTPLYSDAVNITTGTLLDVGISYWTITSITHESIVVIGTTVGPTSFVRYRINSTEIPNSIKTSNFTEVINGTFEFTSLDLIACSNYIVEVWPLSNCSDESEEQFKQNKTFATHPASVINLSVTAPTPGDATIVVIWEPPEIKCKVENYNVSWIDTEKDSDFKTTTNTNLNITGLKFHTQYEVGVAVVSEFGSSSPLISKTVTTRMEKPSKPKDLTLDPCSRSINVSYKAPVHPDGNIDYYQYCYFPTGKITCTTITVTPTEIGGNNFTIPDLNTTTNYTVKVWAVIKDNDTMLPGNSAEKNTETLLDVGVIDLNISYVTDNSVMIEGSTQGPTASVSYRINPSEVGLLLERVSNSKFNFTSPDLTACTDYSVEVWPSSYCSGDNFEKLNKTEFFKTKLGPVKISKLNAITPDAGSAFVQVSWQPPSPSVQCIISYNVSWYLTGNVSEQQSKITPDNQFNITDLEFYKNYTITVAVTSDYGNSSELVSTTVFTRMKKPEAPEGLNVHTCSRLITFDYNNKTVWSDGVIHRYVYCVDNSSEAHCGEPSFTWSNTTTNHEEVQNLQPLSIYNIKLSAASFDLDTWLYSAPSQQNFSTEPDIALENMAFIDTSNDRTQITGETIGPVESVQLQYRAKGTDSWQDKNPVVGNNRFSFTITNLMNCTNYDVRITATSNCSQDKVSSEGLNFTTLSPVPPAVEEPGVVTESRAANISWLMISPETFACPILNYTVTYKPVNNSYENEAAKQIISSTENVRLDDLHPYTAYNVSIVAETSGGKGLARDFVFTTNTTGPVRPENVTIVECTSRSCNVSWVMPIAENGPRDFTIYCKNSTGPDTKQHISGPVKIFSSEVIDLRPYTNYSCWVVVSIEGQENRSDESQSMRTLPDAPEQPSDFLVKCSQGSNPGQATWNLNSISNGVVSKFTIKYRGLREGVTSPNCDGNFTFGASGEGYIWRQDLSLAAECNYTSFSIEAFNDGVNNPSVAAVFPGCFQSASKPPKPQDALNKINIDVNDGVKDKAVISFSRDLFSEDHGKIRNYSIIIYTGEKRNDISKETLQLWQDVYYKKDIDPYVATPIEWNPFTGDATAYGRSGLGYAGRKEERCSESKNGTVHFTLGCDKKCAKESDLKEACNGPLQPDKTYYAVIRGSTNAGFTDTPPKKFETGEIAKDGVVAALTVSLILLVIIIVAGIFIHYRKNDLKKLFSIKPNVDSGTQTSSLTISNRSITRPENIADFQAYYQTMAADSGLKFSQEYEELKAASPVLPKNVATQLENRAKNRWINILPFDQSRVKLLPISDDATTDYINACYIPGVNSPREYIATQGPLPGTKDDFWRMVWEQSSQMIVMVTQLVERGKVKCEQYWPDDRDVHYYGDLAVQLRSESILNGFVIRIFDLNLAPANSASSLLPEVDMPDSIQLLSNSSEQGTRSLEVKQMHFTKWPDFGCPDNTSLLINFVQAVREHLPRENTGPIIVHCSAGVGRTGTFIAVDRLIQHLKTHDYVDIYGVVLDMRNYRVNMVQTEDQYVYIHECIRDILSTAQESTDDGEAIYENITGTQSRDSQL